VKIRVAFGWVSVEVQTEHRRWCHKINQFPQVLFGKHGNLLIQIVERTSLPPHGGMANGFKVAYPV
jgi:hypothetical protein